MTDDRAMKQAAGGPEGSGAEPRAVRGAVVASDTGAFRSNPFIAHAAQRPSFGRQSFALHGFAPQADKALTPAGNLASQFGLAVAYADPAELTELSRRFQSPVPEAAADLPRVAVTLTGSRHASLWPGPQSPPPAPRDLPEPASSPQPSPHEQSAHDAPGLEADFASSKRADAEMAPGSADAVPQVLELGTQTLAVLRGIEAQLATLTRLVEAQAAARPPEKPEPFGEITHGDATQPMTWPPLGESIESPAEQGTPEPTASELAIPGGSADGVDDGAESPAPVNREQAPASSAAGSLDRDHWPDAVAFAGDRRLEAGRDVEATDIGVARSPAVTQGTTLARRAMELPQHALFPTGGPDPQRMAEEADRVARIHRATRDARQAADVASRSGDAPSQALPVAERAPATSPSAAPRQEALTAPAGIPATEAAIPAGRPSGSAGIMSVLAFAIPRWLALIAVILAAGIVLHLLTGGTFETLPAGLVSSEWWSSLFMRVYRTLERIDRFMLDLLAPAQRALVG